MKRFHVHLSIHDLPQSIRFYSSLFGTEPTVVKGDYAKWMLEDPRVNFAVSTRGPAPGLNHLGLQVEDEDELRSMRTQLKAADSSLIEETAMACCYATSDKYWITDPQGIAWESFRTLESESTSAACCVPAAASGDACCAT
jgi:lactoylglutathione lyase